MKLRSIPVMGLAVAAMSCLSLSCSSKSESNISFDTTTSTSTAPVPPMRPLVNVPMPTTGPGSVPGGVGQPQAPPQQMITIGPKDASSPSASGGTDVPPAMPAMPRIAPSPVKEPTPALAPKLPPESAMVHHGDTVISPSGLKYIDLRPGSGPTPAPGNVVSVAFVGMLPNGKVFDASTSLTTQLDVGQLIPGWDEGLLTMKKGGKRRLIIPPALAFGANGKKTQVPGKTTVIYDVDMLLVQP